MFKYSLDNKMYHTLNYELTKTFNFSVNYKYEVPVIGKDDVFNCKSGNKLTKSKTISCRGKANTELSKYGSEFKLISLDNGTFIMDGGIEVPYIENTKKKQDSKIKVIEDENPEVLPMEATLDAEGIDDITEEFKFEL